jgi:Flp pilus assembly protein TadB
MTWPPYRPPLTRGQQALRGFALGFGILGPCAIVAQVWAAVVVCGAIALGLTLVSAAWERVARRRWREQSEQFEKDADALLRALFGDGPKQQT